MKNYSEHIPEELARKLLDWGYPLFNYKGGTYDGKPCFDIPGYGEPGWADGNRYQIPTYGEVFDWFTYNKKIIIILEPFFTYSLRDNIAYNWKIYYMDPELGLVLRTEDDEYKPYDGYGGSFKLTANAAIESAMRIGDKSVEVKYIEVNIDEL